MKSKKDSHPFAELMEVAGSIYEDFDLNQERNSQAWTCDKALGNTFEVEGVRIKFVGTGDYETIEISKI